MYTMMQLSQMFTVMWAEALVPGAAGATAKLAAAQDAVAKIIEASGAETLGGD